MTGDRCGYAVVDRDGEEQPCDRPATGWRWYQDCDHEDALDVACDLHANEGGRRLAAAELERNAAQQECADLWDAMDRARAVLDDASAQRRVVDQAGAWAQAAAAVQAASQ